MFGGRFSAAICRFSTLLTSIAVVVALFGCVTFLNPDNGDAIDSTRSGQFGNAYLFRPFGTPTTNVFVCGDFTTYNGSAVPRGVIRLSSAGIIDASFNGAGAGFNGPVYGCLQEVAANGVPTGKLIVAGFFSTYNGAAVPSNLVRLNSNGTFDNTFNLGGSGLGNAGYLIIRELSATGLPTGKILLTGGFAGFNSYNGAAAPANFIRINADGTLDSSFNGGGAGFAGGTVLSAAQEFGTSGAPTGKFIVGGTFTTHNGAAVPHGLVRLNSNGIIDASFNGGNAGFGGGYLGALFILPELAANGLPTGKTLVTGSSSGSWTYNGVATPDRLIRVNADGTVDVTYNSGGAGIFSDTRFLNYDFAANGYPNGKVLVAGSAAVFNGGAVPVGVMRLNFDGSFDSTFNGGASGFSGGDVAWVETLYDPSNVPAGGILVGGGNANTTYNGTGGVPAHLSKLSSTGAFDGAFNSGGGGFNGAVNAVFQERQ